VVTPRQIRIIDTAYGQPYDQQSPPHEIHGCPPAPDMRLDTLRYNNYM